jgi:hypothetical protein
VERQPHSTQVCKVGEHSVVGVREREAATIEERKKRLTSTLVDVQRSVPSKWSVK